jgi:hypothetical protein
VKPGDVSRLIRCGLNTIVDLGGRPRTSVCPTDERGPTAAAFWTRAAAFFAAHGIVAQRILTWLHIYNHHRAHTSLGQLPPVSRLNNVSGHYS